MLFAISIVWQRKPVVKEEGKGRGRRVHSIGSCVCLSFVQGYVSIGSLLYTKADGDSR